MPDSNNLTIYLIKSRFNSTKKIVNATGRAIKIKSIGTFFTHESLTKQPMWLERFFKGKLGDINLFLSSAKGVLITSVLFKNKKVFFAVSFGAGRHMLNDDAIEEGFGLKVTLNSVQKDSIRSIEKSNIGANSKISKEQMSRSTNAGEFGIDIEQDLIRAVTGKSKFGRLGVTISGADALNVSAKVDITNIKDFLIFCHGRYLSKDYMTDFDWIDQIQHIKNPALIGKLEAILLKKFNKKEFHKLWMAVPDLMDWSELQGFKYIPRQEELSDDLSIEDFREAIGEIENLDILHHKHVQAISAITESKIDGWNSFKCLYGEIEYQTKQFVLNSGKWYEIDSDFVNRVNRSYSRVKVSEIELPDYDHENEGAYNIAVSEGNSNFLLMDKRQLFMAEERIGSSFAIYIPRRER